MSKIDFKNLVEQILLFESLNEFKKLLQGKITVTDEDLNRIYTLLASSDRYIPGERWESSLEATPVLDFVVKILGNNYRDVKNKISKEGIDSAESFYTFVFNILKQKTNEKALIQDVLPLDQGFNFQTLNADVKTTYDKALKHRTNNVLIQNVWPTINQETIIDGISKIVETRLTGLERTKISINLIKNYALTGGKGTSVTYSLPTFKTLLDTFLKDLFFNTADYSRGSKKANPDIVNVLNNINLSYEDILKIAVYTRQVYESLLYTEYPDADEDKKKKAAIEASLGKINENTFTLAKNGMFVYTLPNTLIGIRPKKTRVPGDPPEGLYTLQKIEDLNLDPGKELIKIIKDVSTGVRTKQSAQRLKSLAGAADALWAISGQKLMP